MKRLFFFFISLFLSSCCNYSEEFDYERFYLDRKVKGFTEYLVSIQIDSLGETTKDTLITDTYRFNRFGNIKFHRQKSRLSTTIIEYNYLGKKLLKGKMLSITTDNDSSFYKLNFEYENCRLIKELSSNENSSSFYEETYFYDAENKFIDKQIQKILFVDKEGNDTTGTKTISDFTRDDDGYVLEKKDIKVDLSTNEKSVQNFSLKRNSKGLVISKKEFDDNEKLVQEFQYKYKYDEIGNWIEYGIYKVDSLMLKRFRVISY